MSGKRITVKIDRKTGRGTIVQENPSQIITVFVQALDLTANEDEVELLLMLAPTPAPRVDPKP